MTDTSAAPTPVDEARLEAFMDQTVGDLAAAASLALAVIGDRLGLYRAMQDAGPLTPEDLAARTGCGERYLREWLSNQAAGGIVVYDPASGTFDLPAEHALAYAEETSPAFVGGGFDVIYSLFQDVPKLVEAFRTGDGVAWGDHDHHLFCGTERFFRTGYETHLGTEWVPALEGVVAKLEAGGTVADVGCGHGASTIVLGRTFPHAQCIGSDPHAPSVEAARAAAAAAGVDGNVTFEVAPAQGFGGTGYDLVCTMDCLHDMGDPLGAARHIREVLDDDGTWLLVEPMAGDRLEDNLHPVGRLFYAASATVCCPNAISQPGGYSLGAQAGEARLREVAEEAGFTRFRRAAETPFNLVLEVRP